MLVSSLGLEVLRLKLSRKIPIHTTHRHRPVRRANKNKNYKKHKKLAAK
jgi:hypothetical protein